jgi:hypothetical protein
MKKRILPLLLSAAAIAFICNCGEETTSSQDVKNVPAQAYVVTEPSFVYVEGDNTFIISQTTGIVTDVQGNVVGNADLNAGIIVDLNGAALASNIDIATLKAVNPPTVTAPAWAFAANDQIYIIYTDGNVTDENGKPIPDGDGNLVHISPDSLVSCCELRLNSVGSAELNYTLHACADHLKAAQAADAAAAAGTAEGWK